jgi:hypothetical protein
MTRYTPTASIQLFASYCEFDLCLRIHPRTYTPTTARQHLHTYYNTRNSTLTLAHTNTCTRMLTLAVAHLQSHTNTCNRTLTLPQICLHTCTDELGAVPATEGGRVSGDERHAGMWICGGTHGADTHIPDGHSQASHAGQRQRRTGERGVLLCQTRQTRNPQTRTKEPLNPQT